MRAAGTCGKFNVVRHPNRAGRKERLPVGSVGPLARVAAILHTVAVRTLADGAAGGSNAARLGGVLWQRKEAFVFAQTECHWRPISWPGVVVRLHSYRIVGQPTFVLLRRALLQSDFVVFTPHLRAWGDRPILGRVN